MHGYRLLRQRGCFAQPASAREAIEDLEVLASPIKAFINDRCNVGPGLAVSVERSVGCKEHGTKQTFGRGLKAALPSLQTTRPRDDDNRYRSYEGIGLKGTSEP